MAETSIGHPSEDASRICKKPWETPYVEPLDKMDKVGTGPHLGDATEKYYTGLDFVACDMGNPIYSMTHNYFSPDQTGASCPPS